MAIQNSNHLDRIFHALGDESRRKMLTTISQRGRCSAGELVNLFDSSQPTISKHLKVMENAGLLEREVQGRQHLFSINAAALQTAETWLQRHVSFWQSSLNRLEKFLDHE